LSEKRADRGVDAVADPDLRSDTEAVAVGGAATPETSPRASSDQPGKTASQTEAAAQGKHNDAQVLPTPVPTGLRLAVAAGSETVTSPVNVASAPEPGVPVEQPSSHQSALTPQQMLQQPLQQAFSNHFASQSPGEVASAAVGQGTVTQQAVPTQGEANQLQPVQPEPTPAAGPSADGTSQQSTGSGTDTPFGRNEGQSGAHHPAMGRALQVQAAVAVQNVAGQPAPVGTAPTLAASGPSEQSLGQTMTGLNAEEPTTTGRVIRGLSAMLQQRGGSMTMRLDPPALGQLRVQMTISSGTVTAEFQPATTEAQALLDRSIATLRSALESQGLTVERLTVHAAPSTSATRETADDQSQQQNQASRHHSDAGDGRSRGRGDNSSQQDTPNHGFAANFAEAFETHATANDDDLSDRTGAQAA
jgi:flagellar hook-length control protein FliK